MASKSKLKKTIVFFVYFIPCILFQDILLRFNSLMKVPCGPKHIGPKGPAHETVTDTEWHIPEVILIQLILLMMSTWLLETF